MDEKKKNPESKVWLLKHTSHVTLTNARSKDLAVLFSQLTLRDVRLTACDQAQ